MSDDARTIDDYQDLRDNARAVMAGVAFQQWKAQVEGQIEGRKAIACAPMGSADEAFERNYSNGEAAGLMQAVMMWKLLEEQAELATHQGEPNDTDQE